MHKRTGISRAAMGAVLVFAVAGGVYAGDPGELFPDVSYDKTVNSPVKDPGKAGKAAPVVVTPRPRPEPVGPVKPADPAVKPPVKPAEHPAPAKVESPAAQENLEQNVGYMVWAPYKLEATRKFLSPDEQAEYEKDFEDRIKKALAGSAADRKRAMDTLTEAVADRSDALKRFVLLQVVGMAIKNGAPLPERSKRAMQVLPMLREGTLEVAQAKADCLWNLGMSAPEEANDKLWRMLAEAEASLAKLQVQAAFPKQAADSMLKARNAFGRMKDKSIARSEIIAESQAWLDYANNATNQLPKLKTVLKDSPKDADANMKVAMAHLVLYADLDAAEEYAQLAIKGELKMLAGTLRKAKFPYMATETDKLVADSIRIAERLVAVAKISPEQIERYALAQLVVDRLDDLKDALPDVVDNPWAAVRAEAAELLKANAFKPLVPRKSDPAAAQSPDQQQRRARMQEVFRRFGGGGGRGRGRG